MFVHLILTAECLAAELVPGAKYWDSERETGKQQHAQLATQSSLHVNKFGTDRRDDGRPPSWLENILVCKYNIFQTFGSGRGPRVWPFRGEVACPSCAGFTADSALWVTILAGGRRFSRCRHGAVCAARRWTDQLQPAWCSLPPLPGPFQHRPHVSALLLGTRAPPHRTNTKHYGASLMSHISTPAPPPQILAISLSQYWQGSVLVLTLLTEQNCTKTHQL